MELFAATTGCQDPTVASLYLERADNDVSRAVNFYFDAPAPNAAEPARVGPVSNTRSWKRQRVESAGGEHQQQLVSERAVRPSMAGGGSSSSSGGKRTKRNSGSEESRHDRAGAALAAPSAEWTKIAESCMRYDRPWENFEASKKYTNRSGTRAVHPIESKRRIAPPLGMHVYTGGCLHKRRTKTAEDVGVYSSSYCVG